MLQTQLDLTHNLIRDLIDRREAALSKFEQLVATPDASLLDTITTTTSATQSPYAKKIPSSTYKGSKNVSSFNYNIFRQDILQRIRLYSEGASTSRRKELGTYLSTCFTISVGTENSACYDAWFKLMRTLEAMDLEVKNDLRHNFTYDSDVQTAHFALCDVSSRFGSLSDAEKAKLETEDLLSALQDLSRAYRLLLKKVEDRALLETFDHLWTLICQLFDICVSLNDNKIKQAYSDIERQVEEERLRIKSNLRLMTEQWQTRLEDAKRQTQKAYSIVERLQKEKSFTAELLKERENEINEIRHPDGMKEFENVMGELTQHLEDMEVRHETTSQLLESIGELINTKKVKKHAKRKDEVGYSLVKSVFAGRNEANVPRFESNPADSPDGKGEIYHRGDSIETCKEDTLRTSLSSGRAEGDLSLKLLRGRSVEVANGETAKLHVLSIGHFLAKKAIERPVPPQNSEKTSRSEQNMAGIRSKETARQPTKIPESVDDYTATVMNASDGESSSASDDPRDEKAVQTDIWQPTDVGTQRTTQTEFTGRRGNRKKTGLLAQLDDEMKRQPPMLNSNVFKLFEFAMFEKLKSDLAEEQLGRPPKSMSDFMLDFLFTQQGLKTLVMKSLGALLSALDGLAKKRHPYGLLFCRVLNVFAERPFDNRLSAFLVRARAQFAELQKGYKTVNTKSEIEYGGSALLVDVSECLVSLFPNHKPLAYEILEHLSIPGLTDFDKGCVVFCGRLAKVGRDFKIFFIQADPQKTGTVDEAAFLSCAQDSFEICLNEQRLMEIYRYLTSGKLHFADVQKLQFKEWAVRAQSKSVAVTKCAFLTVVAEVYWMEEQRLQEKLKVAYEQQCASGLSSLSDFQRLVQSLEPNSPTEAVVHLYREALELSSETCSNPDFVTKEAFCDVGLKYRLGSEGLKAFSSTANTQLQFAMETSQKFFEDTE